MEEEQLLGKAYPGSSFLFVCVCSLISVSSESPCSSKYSTSTDAYQEVCDHLSRGYFFLAAVAGVWLKSELHGT